MTTETAYKVIGTRPLRPDGTEKVTGRAQFGIDVRLPGMLYARVKRSPHAHAVIKKIDVSRALALRGVKAVITAADFPSAPEGAPDVPQALRFQMENFLASRTVLYRGHAVAAVAATDPHIAEDALQLIDVEYEVLPHVLDVREAMVEGAPVLHEDLRTQDTSHSNGAQATATPTNIAAHMQFVVGDVARGFEEADVLIEREYTTSMYHQGYIEMHNGTAYWSQDGHLTLWVSCQAPHNFRQTLSQLLKVPLGKITVVPMEIGGGFGGKLYMQIEPLACLLAKKAGRPVQMRMTREECFEATGPSPSTYVRVKLGARRDGTIIAGQAYLAYGAGAFPGSPLGGGMMGIFAPYHIPNILIDGYDVVCNRPKTGAYRAPGTPASMFAGEATINELAGILNIDPMELRIRNAAQDGEGRPFGGKWGVIGNLAVMNAIKDHPHYKSELLDEDCGRGVAMGYWSNAGGETSASASLNADGTVQLVLGAVDIGGSRASSAMMLAETLGIAAEDINPHVADTDSVGFTLLTGGSRTTFANGWAVYELGMEIRKRLCERAARIWECDLSQVTYGDDGVVHGPPGEDGDRSMTFKQIAAQLGPTGGSIEVGVNVNKQSVGPGFGGHIVDVRVDRETGKVQVIRYTAVQDVGRAIHPDYVEGQIQGAAVQGMGMALTEEYVYGPDGRMQNPSFLDYRIPTALDPPMIDIVLVEVPNPGHPFGVRGVGEVPVVPPLPAIQTAIAAATGIHFYQAPMTPQVILERLLPDDG